MKNDFIAGKDADGGIRWRDYLKSGLGMLPVVLGVYGAERLESPFASVLSVGAGLGLALVALYYLGRGQTGGRISFRNEARFYKPVESA